MIPTQDVAKLAYQYHELRMDLWNYLVGKIGNAKTRELLTKFGDMFDACMESVNPTTTVDGVKLDDSGGIKVLIDSQNITDEIRAETIKIIQDEMSRSNYPFVQIDTLSQSPDGVVSKSYPLWYQSPSMFPDRSGLEQWLNQPMGT